MFKKTECNLPCELSSDEEILLETYDNLPDKTKIAILAYLKSFAEEQKEKREIELVHF